MAEKHGIDTDNNHFTEVKKTVEEYSGGDFLTKLGKGKLGKLIVKISLAVSLLIIGAGAATAMAGEKATTGEIDKKINLTPEQIKQIIKNVEELAKNRKDFHKMCKELEQAQSDIEKAKMYVNAKPKAGASETQKKKLVEIQKDMRNFLVTIETEMPGFLAEKDALEADISRLEKEMDYFFTEKYIRETFLQIAPAFVAKHGGGEKGRFEVENLFFIAAPEKRRKEAFNTIGTLFAETGAKEARASFEQKIDSFLKKLEKDYGRKI